MLSIFTLAVRKLIGLRVTIGLVGLEKIRHLGPTAIGCFASTLNFLF